MNRSLVIKCVAGAGKTTDCIKVLSRHPRGLYLAFTNSVVDDIKNKGYMASTIDSFFMSFLLPKLVPLIPIIADGARFVWFEGIRGMANIKISHDGRFFNKSKPIEEVCLSTDNNALHELSNFNSKYFLVNTFTKDEVKVDSNMLNQLSNYALDNFSDHIEQLMRQCFDYVIFDEAQDLSGYKEKFAELMHRSRTPTRILGDDNQNIRRGGEWFELIASNMARNKTFRCPSNTCDWIRETLKIDIHAHKFNSSEGQVSKISWSEVQKCNAENTHLLYSQISHGKIHDTVSTWKGPKSTIGHAKGSTINSDVVVIGDTLRRKAYYVALTRSTMNTYTTIKKST